MDSSTSSFVLRETQEEKATLDRAATSSFFSVCAAANPSVDGGTDCRGTS